MAGVMLYFVTGAFEMVPLLNSRTTENEPDLFQVSGSLSCPFLKRNYYVNNSFSNTHIYFLFGSIRNSYPSNTFQRF